MVILVKLTAFAPLLEKAMRETELSVFQPTVNYSHRAKQSGEVFTAIEYRLLIKVTFTLFSCSRRSIMRLTRSKQLMFTES